MHNTTLNHIRITETGTAKFLQFSPDAGEDWATLRPLGTPDHQHIVCLGTVAEHRWYFLQDLLDGLASDEYTFSVTTPLPPPAKPDWGDLSEAAIAFAVNGSLGTPLAAMRAAAGSDADFLAAQAECMAAGLTPHKASVVGPLWDATMAARRAANARAASTLHVEPSKTAAVDMSTIVYNVPRTLTQDQLDSVNRRIAIRASQRIKWPFATMTEGQSVFIESALALKGQRAAHAYGAAVGAAFVTHRLNNGDLEVIRTSTTRPLRAKKGK